MNNEQKSSRIYTRPLCPTERLYLIFNELCPPFANQLVLEGHGKFDLRQWREAVARASEANPGSRLILKGHWAFSRWVDSGIAPRVREVDGSRWDGCGPDGAPFEREPLPYREGPTCEVVLIHGDPLRVVFRSHHAVMDGRGTLHWVEEIFRALRGENLQGSDSRITELELARSFQKKWCVPVPSTFISPVGKAEGRDSGVVWRRLHLSGRYKNLVAQCAVLLAQATWMQGEGSVRFGVSVDMRPRRPDLRSTGNLTNLLYLDVARGMRVNDVVRDIAGQMEEKNDGIMYWGDRLILYAPLSLIRREVKRKILRNHQRGIYSISGLLSNPGKLFPERLSCDTFKTETGFFIPPSQQYYPLFIAMSGTSESVELVFSMSRVLATDGHLEYIIENIRNGLVPS